MQEERHTVTKDREGKVQKGIREEQKALTWLINSFSPCMTLTVTKT